MVPSFWDPGIPSCFYVLVRNYGTPKSSVQTIFFLLQFPVEEWLIIQISDTKLASLSSVLASSATILEEFSIVSTCQLCLLEREEKNWQETSHNGRNPLILCENSLLFGCPSWKTTDRTTLEAMVQKDDYSI